MKIRKLFIPLSVVFILSACGGTGQSTPSFYIPEALTPARPLDADFNFVDFEIGKTPIGVNVSYYTNIYSRGFAWFTDNTVQDSKLYLVESGKNYEADFTNAEEYDGETITVDYKNNGKGFSTSASGYEQRTSSGGSTQTVNVHKVHVENLKKNTSYSYRIGTEDNWKYGAFTTEDDNIESITAIQVSDAQTYTPEKLTTFRNTMEIAVKTAGDSLDTILYNGDLFDQNMANVNGKTINNILRYTKANDAIQDIKSMTPFVSSSGNHEPSCPYCTTMGQDVKFGAFDYKGNDYSYDYGNTHFIVLNSNRLADSDANDEEYLEQINWLKADLDSDASKNAKWKVVMFHIACYSTGDHCNDSDNQRLVERLSPLFSKNHVDLVLQAHDHTYNKTLPYRWDAQGYTQSYDDSAIVNLSPRTRTIDGREFDDNPEGTYYVTTGAAGHRAGSGGKNDNDHEYNAGVFAEVKLDNDGKIVPADSSQTYRNRKYKLEVGKLTHATKLDPYKTNKNIQIEADYKVGDPATACPDGQMFGVLNIKDNELTYDSYLIKTGNTSAKIFDTLSIYKD